MEIRNNLSPNFGMALRIKNTPEMAAKLKELPMNVVEKISQAGKDLKNTQYYHVELGDDLVPRLISKEGAYWGTDVRDSIVRYGDNDNLMFDKMYGVSRLGIKTDDGYVPHNAWALWGPMDSPEDIEHVAKLAVKLDDAAIKYAKEEAAKKALAEAEKVQASKMVDDLMSHFSVEG